MKTRSLVSFTILFALLSFVSSVEADTYRYKWKNSEGETQYSDRPPAAGVAFEKIRVKSSKTGSAPSPKYTLPTQKNEAKEEKKDTYGGWRKENCTRAIQNLDILENSNRIAKDDGKGGTRVMTEEEKKAQIKKMSEQKEKYCEKDGK